LDIPGGGNTVPPPLTAPTTPTAPPTGTGTVGTTTGTPTDGKDKKKKGKKNEKERKLPKLGPDKPGALAAPVSAVARGTTPGILPLTGVLVAILLATLAGRRLIRNRTA
jgi:hypothetical protein